MAHPVLRRVYTALRVSARQISYALRPPEMLDDARYSYQRPLITHQHKEGERVLDVGSGGDPYPFATVLCDRFLEPTEHRTSTFVSHGKPVIIADIHALPFIDKVFDFVVCAHVLEHVENPIVACQELQRVAKAGYIETPTLGKDTLFAWAEGMHRWHLVAIANRLVFFEYSPRYLQGIRSGAFRDVIFGATFHPLQPAFNQNQDVLNVYLNWRDQFNVTVFRLDGSVETL